MEFIGSLDLLRGESLSAFPRPVEGSKFVSALAHSYQNSHAKHHEKLQCQNPSLITVPKPTGDPPETAFSILTPGASILPLHPQWSEEESELRENRRWKKRDGKRNLESLKMRKQGVKSDCSLTEKPG